MVDIAIALVTPEGGVREAQSNLMFCLLVMFRHVPFDIPRASDSLALQANPVLAFILASDTLEL